MKINLTKTHGERTIYQYMWWDFGTNIRIVRHPKLFSTYRMFGLMLNHHINRTLKEKLCYENQV